MDGSRIWKGKVADSKISGYVWTRPKRPVAFGIFSLYDFELIFWASSIVLCTLCEIMNNVAITTWINSLFV